MINKKLTLRLAALSMMAALLPFAGNAAYSEGYYDSLNGKCGVELAKAIKNLCWNHTQISYSKGTWQAFLDTDVREINGKRYWWDMYSDNLVEAVNSTTHSGLNVEHSVPNSWWYKDENAAYKDLVHLNPSNIDANSRKSNYPLAEVKKNNSYYWTNGVSSVGDPKDGLGGGSGSAYEPADEYKGDFARAYMYMFVVYNDQSVNWQSKYGWMYNVGADLMLKTWASAMLMRWNDSDPVGEKERVRNDAVQQHQGNRNPFIDLPDLPDYIWGEKKNVPYSVDGNSTPDIPDTPDVPGDVTERSYTWLASSNTSLDDDWTIENVELPSATSNIWSWRNINTTYYLNASAYISSVPYDSEAYAWSPAITFVNLIDATVSFSHAAKFQTTCKQMCKLVVRNTANDEITEYNIPNWPAAGSWAFADSGDIDLSKHRGQVVQIGLKYASDTTGADTWEVNNMKLDLKYGVTAVESIDEDPDDSDLVEVYGNHIYVPEGAQIFDLNGRRVSGHNVASGIYIVVKSTFKKAVKVMVK